MSQPKQTKVSKSNKSRQKASNSHGLSSMDNNNNTPKTRDREQYIDYALDMVINNLVNNGHLDVCKAPQMRTPLMKSQIASLCDKILATNTSKSTAEKMLRSKSSSTRSSSQKNEKVQKWALQPAALPITIITDQVPPVARNIIPSMDLSMATAKKLTTSTSNSNQSDDFKKTKSKPKKTKSSDASSIKKSKILQQQEQQPPPNNAGENSARSTYQASSEVPSAYSIGENMNRLSSSITTAAIVLEEVAEDIKEAPRTVQFKGSELFKVSDVPSQGSSRATTENAQSEENKLKRDEGIVLTPIFHPPTSASSAGTASCPSVTKTGTANSPDSKSSTAASATGYQILVDMTGFQSDEISMEVEGRQLIFIAVRPKREGVNIRKVTEVIDVPPGVVMENLKIGRRVDGYVIVEEHDDDNA